MGLRVDIFIQTRVKNVGAEGIDYSVLLKEADVYGFKRKKVINIINNCYLVKEVNGSKKVYEKQQGNKKKVVLNKDDGYDFYKSLKRDTDNVKTDIIRNIVNSYASRQQGVLYPYLVKVVVEDMGYDKKTLDELISSSYITKNIQGILTIFTHKSAFPKPTPTPTPTPIKGKEDYIDYVTKNIINKPTTKKAKPKAKKDKPFEPMPIPKHSKNISVKKRETHYNMNNETPTWMKQFPTKDDLNFCCYRFIGSNNKIIYVGRAKNLVNRLETHEHLPEECYEQIVRIEYCKFDSNDDLYLAEPYFIAKWKPQYNQDFVNKNYSFQIKELENIGWREFKGGIEIISKKH